MNKKLFIGVGGIVIFSGIIYFTGIWKNTNELKSTEDELDELRANIQKNIKSNNIAAVCRDVNTAKTLIKFYPFKTQASSVRYTNFFKNYIDMCKNPEKNADELAFRRKNIFNNKLNTQNVDELALRPENIFNNKSNTRRLEPPFKNCRDMQEYFNTKVDYGSTRMFIWQGLENYKIDTYERQTGKIYKQHCGSANADSSSFVTQITPKGKRICNGEVVIDTKYTEGEPDWSKPRVDWGWNHCKWLE